MKQRLRRGAWHLKMLTQRVGYERAKTQRGGAEERPLKIEGLFDRRPVSSVGRATDCCAGGRRFKPRPDQHSGSLNNRGERAAFVMTPANG